MWLPERDEGAGLAYRGHSRATLPEEGTNQHTLPPPTHPQNDGRLDATSTSLAWQSRAGDKTVKLSLASAKQVAFYDMGRSCQLWVTDGSGSLVRFDGFRPSDYDRLATYFSDGGHTLAKKELSSKGRNWGSARINGAQLEMLDDSGRVIAPIPLNQISQAALPGKNELEVQFFDDDTGGFGWAREAGGGGERGMARQSARVLLVRGMAHHSGVGGRE